MSQGILLDEPVVEHLCIQAKDRERLKSWYREMLGFDRILVDGKESGFLRSKNGFVIEFVDAAVQKGTPEENVSGFGHLAFAVDSFEKVEEKLQAMNIRIERKSVASDVKMLFFSDPENNSIQIVHRSPAL